MGTRFGYRFSTSLFAILLLIAAGLKAHTVYTSFRLGGTNDVSVWTVCAVVVEWVVAAWLLCGLAPLWARRAVLGLLAIFLIVGMVQLARGKTNCGCFGRLQVHPVSTLTLDAFVALCIWYFGRPKPAETHSHTSGFNGRGPVRISFASILLSLGILPGTFLASELWRSEQHSGSTIFLDFQSMVGQRFPLLNSIPLSSRWIANGRSTVVLISGHCSKCQRYMQERDEVQASSTDGPVCIIDLDPLPGHRTPGDPENPRDASQPIRLLDHARYVAMVPVELQLEDGRIESVKQLSPDGDAE